MDQETIDKIRNKVDKKLGGTKYSGVKKKPKKDVVVHVEKALEEDRKLKAKIRNLQKEELRIQAAADNSKKVELEKKNVSDKIKKLLAVKGKLDSKKKY